MLQKASSPDLDAILLEWSDSTLPYGDEGIVYANDIKEKIESLQKSIVEPNNFAYIFKNQDGQSRALLSIIHALPKSDVSWLKFLDLDLHPDLVLGDFDFSESTMAIYESIFDSIDLLFKDYTVAKELKIFGRTPTMVKVFNHIARSKVLKGALDNADIICSISGKWIIFRKK